MTQQDYTMVTTTDCWLSLDYWAYEPWYDEFDVPELKKEPPPDPFLNHYLE